MNKEAAISKLYDRAREKKGKAELKLWSGDGTSRLYLNIKCNGGEFNCGYWDEYKKRYVSGSINLNYI